jgi:hypothetical protein
MKNFKEFKKLNEQTHEESRKRQLDTIKRANIYTFLKGVGFETGTDYVQNDSKNRFIVKDKETAESMIDELALFDLFDIMVSGPDPLVQSDINEIERLRIFDWSNPVTIQVKRIGDLMEAELKGNLGLPGEDGEGENFLGKIKRQKDAIYGRVNPMQVGRELMSIQSYLSRKTKGKEKELEKLALDLINHLYGDVLGDVEMDIKMVDSGEDVKDFLDDMTKKSNKPKKQKDEEEEEEEQEEQEQEVPEIPEDLERKIKLETDKRKIANLIIQGEALNVKTVIEMPECVDRIKRIFGEQEGEVYIQNLIRITELGKALDWFIPTEHKAMSMEQHPEGFAGACHIDWDGDDEDGEEGGEEGGEPEDFTPVLRVVGVDFVMLIHESVKAVYEYLSTPGISKDPEIAQIVKSQTSSFADEADEFKYGSEVAAELRDFVNINPKVDRYPNIREYIYMALMEMDAEDFLFLMKGILSSTPMARKKIDSMIDEFIASMEQYERDLTEWEQSQKETESEPESDIDKMIRLASTGGEDEEESDESDYSKMSNSQLNDLIDDALDREDYKEVEKLSKFLKESVYNRIIENYIDKKIKR